MNLQEMKDKYAAIMADVKSNKRSIDEAQGELDTLTAEIKAAEDAAKKAFEDKQEQHRSIAAAQQTIRENLNNVDSNTYFRSIAKGASDVGNKEVISDIVRVYEETSPIYAAHGNVQVRSTGNTFQFTKVAKGSSDASVKAEGASSDTDSTSSVTVEEVKFKTYRSEKITITQEMLDDAAANVAQEVTSLGMAKSVNAFGADAIKALREAFGAEYNGSGVETTPPTFTTAPATTQALSTAFFSIPSRNRRGVKYIGNSDTAAMLVELIGVEAGPRLSIIGLTADNLVIDDNVDENVVILCNPTLALAIGRKEPVRVWVDEVEAGRVIEVQPRFAVALRDASACAAVELEPSEYA